MSVRIEGVRELRVRLDAMGANAERNVRREVLRSALAIQTGAKTRSPVDTGRLRNSIAVEVEPDGLAASIGSNVEYAPYVEFGTRRQTAQPYLFPAFEEERAPFEARLRQAMREA